MSPVRRVFGTYRAAFSGLPRDAWLVSAVVFVNRSGTMVLPFLALFLTRERGYSVVEAGRVLAMFGAGSILGSYAGGWMSDRIGPILTQQVSLVGGGFGVLVLGHVSGRWALPLTAFAVAAVLDLFRPASMTALARTCEGPMQARAFALLRLAINLGMSVGPAVGGFLARRSYSWIFIGDAATCFAAAALLFRVHGLRPRAAARATQFSERSRPPWKDRPFLILLSLVFVIGCVFFQLFGTFPLYARAHFGIDEAGIGMLLALNAGLIVVFEMVLMHSVEGRERLPLAAAGAFLICLGFGLMPFGHAIGWAIFTVVVWSAGEMFALPILNAVVAERAGAANSGKYLGAYSTAYSVAFAAAPLLGAWAYETLGPNTLWYAIGGLGFILWAALAALAPSFRTTKDGRRC